MDNLLTTVARLMALACALLFVVVVPPVVFGVLVEGQLLRPEPYKEALVTEQVYARLPGAAAEIITSPGEVLDPAGSPLALLRSLNRSDYELLLSRLLTRQWMQTEAESVIDQVFAYLESDVSRPEITVSLLDVRQRIGGDAGVQAVLAVILSKPACEAGEGPQLLCTPWLESGALCRPAELQLQACRVEIGIALAGAATLIPDQVDVAQWVGLASPAPAGATDVRVYLRWLRLGNRVGWVIPLVLLITITLFGVRSLKGWLRWWGAPVAAAGAGLALLGLVTWLYPTWFLQAVVPDVIAATRPLAALVADVLGVLGQRMALWLGGAGIVLGAGGIGALLLSLFFRRKPS